MTTRESTRSTDEGPLPERAFYGLADHPNHGIFSSILKRKRKFAMTDEAKKMCQQVEAYKSCADRLHLSLMFMLVENPVTSKQLHERVAIDLSCSTAGSYLRFYEAINRKGRKLGTKSNSKEIESVEPAAKTLLAMNVEQEKRCRKQLENLKALSKFIGEDYWEYARLRKVYWEAMEQYDEAVTNQNKERSEQAEQATASAQTKRNDCRMKMMDFIVKSINDQRGKHAEAVLKFRDEAILYHKAMSDLIPDLKVEADAKPESKSSIKPPK
ncbi:hypothetical protein GCK72_002039 [Caenorhabditis remanei]|nr:hypothetical protein GCK72_002039 [Caenorhabditis remanei]KAF1770221.1 hypothetical protein GCK72_002039 [Caenorhabditis remanei]